MKQHISGTYFEISPYAIIGSKFVYYSIQTLSELSRVYVIGRSMYMVNYMLK